jgi:hypothetical protein
MEHGLNWAAVGVAALAKFVIGWLWFSPVLFYKPWKRLAGVGDSPSTEGMGKSIAIWVIGALVTSWMLAHFLHWTNTTSALRGMAMAFHIWLGFVLVFMLDDYAAEKRPFGLVAIKAGNQLVGLLVMGAILGAWQ